MYQKWLLQPSVELEYSQSTQLRGVNMLGLVSAGLCLSLYLHRAASQLLIQLHCEECRGCNLILRGVGALPGEQGQIPALFSAFPPTHTPYRDQEEERKSCVTQSLQHFIQHKGKTPYPLS